MPLRTLAVAPHPDDEILGCGGTLLRRVAEGGEVAWLIVTAVSEAGGFTSQRVRSRNEEIERVASMVGFARVFRLDLPTMRLDTLPRADVVQQVSRVFAEFEPQEVLLPNRTDAHSDHRVVFDAVSACVKWFRYPYVRRVMAYETVSETEFGLDPAHAFTPNYFVDITAHLERKLEIMSVYASEVQAPPFPRSLENLRSLARLRGATAGFGAAEAFDLLRDRE